jgi:hypothetical protein
VKTRLNTLETAVFNNQSGTTYTLVLADATSIVVMSNAAANTLTIPTNASVAFSNGTEIRIRQGGAGITTIAAAGGVTLVNPFSSFVMAGQYAEAKLLKIGTNSWSLNGEVA